MTIICLESTVHALPRRFDYGCNGPITYDFVDWPDDINGVDMKIRCTDRVIPIELKSLSVTTRMRRSAEGVQPHMDFH